VINQKPKSWGTWLTSGITGDTNPYHFGTALILAAQNGHAEICQKLLLAGASKEVIKTRDDNFYPSCWGLFCDNGLTALEYAAFNSHVSVVKVFAAAGAKLHEFFSELLDYARASGWTVLRTLLQAGLDVNSPVGGRPFIVRAAYESEGAALVEDLIAAGADVNAQCSISKTTALIAASSSSQSETVKVLLEAGAKVDVQDADGKTALMQYGNRRLTRLLAEFGNKFIKKGSLMTGNWRPAQVVKLLVEAGANLNLRDKDGKTVFEIAARSESKYFLAALKEAGVSIPRKKFNGLTLLMIAAKCEDADYEPSSTKVDFLCELGFDPNEQDSDGNTALLHAVNALALKNIQALIRCGSDLSIRNHSDQNVLDIIYTEWTKSPGKGSEIKEYLEKEYSYAMTSTAQAKRQTKESCPAPGF
jgi:ankyrin repeat protein